MASTKNNSYFPALTGVRAIAAFMVFIYHYNPFNEKVFGKGVYGFFHEFHASLNLFFVLSGFLITYRYYDAEKQGFKKYLINRVARIYPVYFALTTITFLFFAFVHGERTMTNLGIYFSNITFIKGFFDDLKFTGISQGWSLTVEECFYFLAPLIFVLIKRSRLYLLLLPIIFLAIGLGLVQLCKGMAFYGFMESNAFMYVFTFFGTSFEFFVGIALALYFKKHPASVKSGYRTYGGAVLIVICIYLLSVIRMNNNFGLTIPLLAITNNILLPLVGISLFYYGLLTEQTYISKLLSSKPFVLFGKSSYAFYLIQAGIIEVFFGSFTQNHMLVFIPLLIVSILVYHYFEEPMNLYIRKRFSGKKNPGHLSS
jgi:peptidoglycan/LPS O-acetylase OafA/YrhL